MHGLYNLYQCIKQDSDQPLASAQSILKQRTELQIHIREKAAKKSEKCDQQMIQRYASKNPPHIYSCGEDVLVKVDSRKWNKVKGKGISLPSSAIGKVIDVRPTSRCQWLWMAN